MHTSLCSDGVMAPEETPVIWESLSQTHNNKFKPTISANGYNAHNIQNHKKVVNRISIHLLTSTERDLTCVVDRCWQRRMLHIAPSIGSPRACQNQEHNMLKFILKFKHTLKEVYPRPPSADSSGLTVSHQEMMTRQNLRGDHSPGIGQLWHSWGLQPLVKLPRQFCSCRRPFPVHQDMLVNGFLVNVCIFLILRNSYIMQDDDTRPNILQHKKEPAHRLLYRDESKLNTLLYRG